MPFGGFALIPNFMHTFLRLLFSLLVSILAGSGASAADRPNIVLIMVDDLGFSDIGCYGSEIKTPNLDSLAANGLRFTQFYNCAKCETTRSTLMSGQYYPEVNNTKLERCITLAEGMKLAGYTTLMTGKWHVTSDPVSRGFDRYFGHLSGACNFFKGDNTFRLDREKFIVPEKGFYTTDANTDYAIRFLDESTEKGRPFFLYVAFNAPHYPLHVPEAEYRKYEGKYDSGWDELRKSRYQRQIELGLIDPKTTKLAPRPADVPAWDSLSEDEKEEHKITMPAFAGMVDRVDQNVGRLISKLKAMGQWENTLLLFLSDNGACPFQRTKPGTRKNWLMPWDPDSYWTYDKGWAHAGNTPFREYKQNQHEGGITTPFIAHWPGHIKKPGSITTQSAHLVDIMATLLDVGDGKYPSSYNGIKVNPARGRSLAPILAGKQRPPHPFIYQTFYGKNNALRVGDWKLVNKNNAAFELYNLAADRSELNNLASREPAKFTEMKTRFEAVQKEIGGKAAPAKGKGEKKKKGKKKK